MAKSYDPIAPVAEEISEEACLLCFDEFQVMIFPYLAVSVVEYIFFSNGDIYIMYPNVLL